MSYSGGHHLRGLGTLDVAGVNNQYSLRVQVLGLPPGASDNAGTGRIPAQIVAAMRNSPAFFADATRAAWVSRDIGGGISIQYKSTASEAARRQALFTALTGVAVDLSPSARFVLPDGTVWPQSRSQADAPSRPSGTTIQVRALQQLLLQKGFSVGASGADGVWGPSTQRALGLASGATIQDNNIAARSTEVALPAAMIAQIRALPDRPVGTAQPSAPQPDAAPVVVEEPFVSNGAEEVAIQILPWAIGAVALLGIGGYFLWKSRHPSPRYVHTRHSTRLVTANKGRR